MRSGAGGFLRLLVGPRAFTRQCSPVSSSTGVLNTSRGLDWCLRGGPERGRKHQKLEKLEAQKYLLTKARMFALLQLRPHRKSPQTL